MKIFLSITLLLFGSSLVFYSLSPYFSALGLIIVSISGCMLLSQLKMKFLALILLLIYIGGMLIVFIYSSALTKDRFPTISKSKEIFILSSFLILWTTILFNKKKWNKLKQKNKLTKTVDIEGASYLFHFSMTPFFILTGYILLMALMAVLNMSFKKEKLSLRAM